MVMMAVVATYRSTALKVRRDAAQMVESRSGDTGVRRRAVLQRRAENGDAVPRQTGVDHVDLHVDVPPVRPVSYTHLTLPTILRV